ncbi:ISPsy18, transposase [Pseudomonas sp. StFLB209]|nr:ISPsy18, transposase [Pseudomonas sp. StFLB209]
MESNRLKGRFWGKDHFDESEYPYIARHCPLSDTARCSSKPTDRAYKLFDADCLYLLVWCFTSTNENLVYAHLKATRES